MFPNRERECFWNDISKTRNVAMFMFSVAKVTPQEPKQMSYVQFAYVESLWKATLCIVSGSTRMKPICLGFISPHLTVRPL